MPFPDTEPPLVLPRHTKVLLVMDVVESVRLMEQDEDGFVQRWRNIVGQTQQRLLPLHGGRIVKSLGDGLMLEFPDAASCVKTALALQDINRAAANDSQPGTRLQLRMGAHLADFVADEHDIYGADVNLTARITTLAGPDEIVITAALRDQITAGLDADIEDLGECHLKHVKEPVRAYRIGPVGHAPVIPAPREEQSDLRPTIAVIPFEARSHAPEHFVIGELIADGVIAQLSRSSELRVISRLSTTAFRGRMGAMDEVQSRLDANFVLSGSYISTGDNVLLMAELADTRRNETVWANRVSGPLADLLQAQSELINTIAAEAAKALADVNLHQSLYTPLPRLDSYALLLGGISLMHRSTRSEFERSHELLEGLIERHNRAAQPRAWLAKWHIFRVVSGFSDDPRKDAHLALEQTKRALDCEPGSALAMAIQGHAMCQMSGDPKEALRVIDAAIALDPNEPMCWLYRSVWSTMWGAPEQSVSEAERAVSLSPLDPLKYYFDMILAGGYSTSRDYEKAIAVARRSLQRNRYHLPTLRVLLGALGESGQLDEARVILHEILKLVPGLTVQKYLGMGSADSPVRQRQAVVLRKLGLPEI